MDREKLSCLRAVGWEGAPCLLLQEISFVPPDNEHQGPHPTLELEWEDFSGQQAEGFADIITFQGDQTEPSIFKKVITEIFLH